MQIGPVKIRPIPTIASAINVGTIWTVVLENKERIAAVAGKWAPVVLLVLSTAQAFIPAVVKKPKVEEVVTADDQGI